MVYIFIILPLIVSLLLAIAPKRLYRTIGIIACLVPGVLSLYSYSFIGMKGTLVYNIGGWPPPFGVGLVVDGLAVFMLVIVNTISFMAVIYSISYMNKYTGLWKYYTLFLLLVTGMNGVILAGDIFNLFVWLEVGTISSYALVAFGTEAEELEASLKYAIISTLASIFVLLGIAFLYSYASTLNMADIARTVVVKPHSPLLYFVVIFFILGFGIKSALVPFHAWLPDAHPSAPAPISAMLSGVLIKSLGIYSLIRIIFNVLPGLHI